jgi:hemerythrin-like domain-containing protein
MKEESPMTTQPTTHSAPSCHGHAHHHGHAGPPTQVLKDEHALILEALEAVARKLSALEAGAAPEKAYFEKAVQFLRGFADQCHHGKEENLLFRRMVDRGFPRQAGPIAVMLSEHETGRAFIRGIAEGTAALGSDPGAAKKIIENGRGYIGLLRAHIDKENHILFPMADNVLTPEDQEHLGKEFERFEAEETGAGVHEAMLKLLEELKAGAR